MDGPTTVVDTDFDNPADVSVVESSHSSQLRFDDPDDLDGPAPLPAAGVSGSAGQENPAATPVGGPDSSILTGTSTPPLFPSIPKTISQSTLVDFMSLWTLLQRLLELPSVPDNSISPAVQSSLPVPEHDSDNKRSATPAGSPARTKSPERFLHTPQSSISSLVRRAKETDRQARTPVRPPRTPVRRSRNHSESRDSRSRSPLSRSSSVESTARDGSPLNFNAALDIPREHFRRTRMLRATARRSLQRNMKSSGKLSLHPRERTRSTLPRLSERPGPLCWTWVIQRFLTECPGWTSRLSRTPWRPRQG